MYQVAVIGAGDRGTAYMKALQEMEQVQLTAVCDIQPERVEKAINKFSFNSGFTDYEKAITKAGPDLVVIAVPAYLHCDIATFAMNNGAHVLTEKPFDLSLKKCFQLKETAKLTGKKLAVGFQYHNIPSHRTMKHIFAQKLLGQNVMLNYVDIRETRPKIAMHDARTGNGGPMVDMTCHFIDLMRWFTGSDPVRVSCQWRTYAKGRERVQDVVCKAPDTASMIIEYDSGDTLNVMVCWGLPPGVTGEQLCFAVGTEGHVASHNFANSKDMMVIREGKENVEIDIPRSEQEEMSNPERTVVQNLLHEIEGTGGAQCSFTDGILGLATSLAAIRSSVLGRPVDIAEIMREQPTVLDCMGTAK